jgi:transposase-like protein
MNTKNKGRAPLYDNALKIAISREYLTSSLGYGALAKKYGFALHTVNGFVRWYKKHYPEDLQPTDKFKEQQAADSHKEPLAKQLREANLKIAGLEMLIETAQKELGIDIVKKPGSKQLLK